MSVLTVILVAVVAGILIYLIHTRLPAGSRARHLLIGLILTLFGIWLLDRMGVWHHLARLPLPHFAERFRS